MQLAEWTGFFSAEVGASASLTGLVTVAISINLARILAVAHLPGRAAESLVSLTAALSLCSVALIPGISPFALGAVALALSLMSLAFAARMQWLTRRGGEVSLSRQLAGAASRLAATLPVGIGGALLLAQAPAGATFVAVGVILTLAVAVMNAWVLLVEIVR